LHEEHQKKQIDELKKNPLSLLQEVLLPESKMLESESTIFG